MAKPSQRSLDSKRAKSKSAYSYTGDFIFTRSICIKRETTPEIIKKCLLWEVERLDLRNEADAAIVAEGFILIPESEL